MKTEPLTIIICPWNSHKSQLQAIREKVFIEEQQVPLELEWDDQDESATHFLVLAKGQPVATARLLKSGQIGRMSVIKSYRKQGIATQLLKRVEQEALEQSMSSVFLHAQTYIQHFYAAQGYQQKGDQFMDAGIPHIEMIKDLV